jgi:hypothetical protein
MSHTFSSLFSFFIFIFLLFFANSSSPPHLDEIELPKDGIELRQDWVGEQGMVVLWWGAVVAADGAANLRSAGGWVGSMQAREVRAGS